LSNLNLIMSRS